MASFPTELIWNPLSRARIGERGIQKYTWPNVTWLAECEAGGVTAGGVWNSLSSSPSFIFHTTASVRFSVFKRNTINMFEERVPFELGEESGSGKPLGVAGWQVMYTVAFSLTDQWPAFIGFSDMGDGFSSPMSVKESLILRVERVSLVVMV